MLTIGCPTARRVHSFVGAFAFFRLCDVSLSLIISFLGDKDSSYAGLGIIQWALLSKNNLSI
jgi:hypothetical protein